MSLAERPRVGPQWKDLNLTVLASSICVAHSWPSANIRQPMNEGRLLRDIAEGRALGDTTTLADPAVAASLKERYSEEG